MEEIEALRKEVNILRTTNLETQEHQSTNVPKEVVDGLQKASTNNQSSSARVSTDDENTTNVPKAFVMIDLLSDVQHVRRV